MNHLVRFLKIAWRVVRNLFLFALVAAIALVLIVGFTSPGARLAASLIERFASTPDQIVRITDPSGLLTGDLKIGVLALTDSKGIYAEVRDLSVEWSPLQLLNYTFDADRVSAGSIRIERTPIPSTETEEVRSTFALPVDVKIGNLDLPEVIIGKAITGQDQSLRLNGSVDATNESIALALTAAQLDRPDAKAVADIVFDPAANELKLEATIDEPRNGVLAKILKLPGEPALNIAITGSGPLSNWQGTATAALDGNQILKLDGRHQEAQTGTRTISLAGGGSVGELVPPAFRPLFQGETSIDLVAAFRGGTTVMVEKGNVENGSFSLTARGTASQQSNSDLTATLTGRSGPIDFRWPLAEGEARALIETATLSLDGAPNAASVEFSAKMALAEFPGGRIEAIELGAKSDRFDLATQTGPMNVVIATGATRFSNADVERLVRGPIRLDGRLALTANAIAFEPLTLESASIGGTLQGQYQRTEQTLQTAFKLFALPAVLPASVAGKFDTTIALSGTVASDIPNGTVSVTGLQITSGTIETSGSVSLQGDGLTASLEGRLPDLGKLLADGSGEANFTATATGPLSGLTVKAEVTSSGATLAGRTLSDLVITADALADPAKPEATLTASGAIDGQAINIRSNVVTQNGAISIPVIEADIGENRINGAITLTPDFKPEGNLTFALPDIGLLAALAGEKASGDLSGQAAIRTVNGVTSVKLEAKGDGIQRDTVTIVKPAVDLTVDDLAALAIKGTITAERVTAGANQADNLRLAFTQAAGRTGFDLGGRYDGGPLVAKGNVETENNRTSIQLDEFSATPRKIALKLASPSTITIVDGTAQLDDLTIEAGNGRVAVGGTAGSALDLDVAINALPATLVNSFAPTLGAEGAISGTVTVTGAASAPSVTYRLNWANAAVAAGRSAGVGAVSIAANGVFANNQVTLDSTISGDGGLSFRGGGTVGIAGNTPLSMKFSGNLPFGLLANQLAAQGFTLTGTAAVDLSISGAAAAPVISGSVSTSGARLLDVRRNLAINDLAARVTLDGQQATIASLGGSLSGGGRIEASGTIGIAPGSGYPANLTVRLLDATYVDGTLFTANTNGTLTLTGSLVGSPVLGGQLTVRKAAITIPEKLPNSLSEINIKHKNAPADVRAMERDIQKDSGGGGGSGGGGIGLDLTITAPGQIFVRGRGIDAELGGDLTVRGTTANPIVSGGFTLRRGRLEILGKRLDFTNGEIGFGGSLVPTIDFEATSATGSTTITVNVAGAANNPTVTFASSPALPQDEVLAQLIFNRSMSNLSALQIAQLASAVSQLAGGGSTSLLDGLRGKLGVDDLDVTTDENGGAQVRAGKYLNDRTYIELQQGSEAGSGKAIINLDVGRGVKLRGEAGSDGSGAAGIFYEKEY